MVFGFFKKSETETLLASQGVKSIQNQMENHFTLLFCLWSAPSPNSYFQASVEYKLELHPKKCFRLEAVTVGMAKCWHPEGGDVHPGD